MSVNENKKGIVMDTPFKFLSKQPLDVRFVLTTEERNSLITEGGCYAGLEVWDSDENKKYRAVPNEDTFIWEYISTETEEVTSAETEEVTSTETEEVTSTETEEVTFVESREVETDYSVGTSSAVDSTSDTQIPTSKAVQILIDNSLGTISTALDEVVEV